MKELPSLPKQIGIAAATLGGIVVFGVLFHGHYAFGIVPLVYLIPTIVAMERRVPNQGSVAVVNILLGWTFIGWAVALAMAVRSIPSKTLAP